MTGSDQSDEESVDEDYPRTASQRSKERLDQLSYSNDGKEMSKLGSLKFMQKANLALKEQNDEEIAQIQKALAGEDDLEYADKTEEQSGRRRYHPKLDIAPPQLFFKAANEFEERLEQDSEDHDEDVILDQQQGKIGQDYRRPATAVSSKAMRSNAKPEKQFPPEERTEKKNPWLLPPKQCRQAPSTTRGEADFISTVEDSEPELAAEKSYSGDAEALPRESEQRSERLEVNTTRMTARGPQLPGSDSDESSFQGFSPPASPSRISNGSATQNEELIRRAFATDDVLAASSFAADKAELGGSDDSDDASNDHNKLPGWGSWTGAGLTKRDRKKANHVAATNGRRTGSAAKAQSQK